jgi:predicted dehydrogenase
MGPRPDVKLGVVGCGKISGVYLENLARFEGVEVVACADLDPGRAREQAERYGVPKACEPAELLADKGIELVVNLTVPQAHATVALAALRAGKHVYNEKPLAISLEDAETMLDEARDRGLRVGCAPDTFLGAGLQTCRKLVDDGLIGEPVAVTASIMGHGPEGWHPDPGFFYGPGAGPLFDMGPYYLTALATLIGSVRRVTGLARASFPERTITSEPRYGEKIEVKTPTHVTGILDFEGGAVGTLVASFDVWASVNSVVIYGSEGTLGAPDPNTFGGPVLFRPPGEEEVWKEMPLTHGYRENSRGLGVADMARALREGGEHRANGELGYHVLEVMHALYESSETGRHVGIESTCLRPAPLPAAPRSVPGRGGEEGA